tara:strand:- start:23 stop:295 length:273 start_codon:yes stop_codon:yes gene_type:complete
LVKKKALENQYKIIDNSSGAIKTDTYKKYLSIFGVEASVILLQEFSSYSTDEIWLFSVEAFTIEVKKYNLKAKADRKEFEAEMNLKGNFS